MYEGNFRGGVQDELTWAARPAVRDTRVRQVRRAIPLSVAYRRDESALEALPRRVYGPEVARPIGRVGRSGWRGPGVGALELTAVPAFSASMFEAPVATEKTVLTEPVLKQSVLSMPLFSEPVKTPSATEPKSIVPLSASLATPQSEPLKSIEPTMVVEPEVAPSMQVVPVLKFPVAEPEVAPSMQVVPVLKFPVAEPQPIVPVETEYQPKALPPALAEQAADIAPLWVAPPSLPSMSSLVPVVQYQAQPAGPASVYVPSPEFIVTPEGLAPSPVTAAAPSYSPAPLPASIMASLATAPIVPLIPAAPLVPMPVQQFVATPFFAPTPAPPTFAYTTPALVAPAPRYIPAGAPVPQAPLPATHLPLLPPPAPVQTEPVYDIDDTGLPTPTAAASLVEGGVPPWEEQVPAVVAPEEKSWAARNWPWLALGGAAVAGIGGYAWWTSARGAARKNPGRRRKLGRYPRSLSGRYALLYHGKEELARGTEEEVQDAAYTRYGRSAPVAFREGVLTIVPIDPLARNPRRRRGKPWPPSRSGRWALLRDGEEVMSGREMDIVDYIHRTHSYSIDHALRYEGYRVVPVE